MNRRTGSYWAVVVAVLVASATWQCQKESGKESKKGEEAAQAKGATRPTRVRAAAKAGSWYAGESEPLAEEVDRLLASATPPEEPVAGPVRALVVPHAGYAFSGVTAASAYKLLAAQTVERVILLGTSHSGLSGLSIADVTHYRTPLGDIPLDQEVVKALREHRLVRAVPDAHATEHSIEIQLPLLQRALRPGWHLVPILVGRLDGDGFAEAAELIRGYADDKTVIVASGDFTHYGESFGYHPFAEGADVPASLRELDMGAYQRLAARDAQGFIDYRAKTGITVCGFSPFTVLIHLLGEQGNPSLVKYETSGNLTKDYASSVSYFAIAFTSEKPLAHGELGEAKMKLLHRLACRTLKRAVEEGADAVKPEQLVAGVELGPRLEKRSGAFVTLKKHGDLRGCIGHIMAAEPLYLAVIDNAVNAALSDRRFEPVQPEELSALEVEVSVLSPLRPVSSYEGFLVGEHGVVLEKDGRRAVYLPEVATEQGWDRAETLSHLARKAGLPSDAWRRGASFRVFTSQKYSAPYRAP